MTCQDHGHERVRGCVECWRDVTARLRQAEARLTETVRVRCEGGGCGACVACRESSIRAACEARLAEARAEIENLRRIAGAVQPGDHARALAAIARGYEQERDAALARERALREALTEWGDRHLLEKGYATTRFWEILTRGPSAPGEAPAPSPVCVCGHYREGYHRPDGTCQHPGCGCEQFVDAALLSPSWAKEAARSLDAMRVTPADLGTIVAAPAQPGEAPASECDSGTCGCECHYRAAPAQPGEAQTGCRHDHQRSNDLGVVCVACGMIYRSDGQGWRREGGKA